MALQPRIIACGNKVATFAMAVRFLTGPAVMAAASFAVGLRGTLLHVAIVQVKNQTRTTPKNLTTNRPTAQTNHRHATDKNRLLIQKKNPKERSKQPSSGRPGMPDRYAPCAGKARHSSLSL
jgi:hypothetical protein